MGSLELNGKLSLFADDTTIFYEGPDVDILFKNAQNDMMLISNWLYNNRLLINTNKTNYIVFRKPLSRLNLVNELYFNNNKIGRVEATKYLGIIIDAHLSWSEHIAHLKKKLVPIVGVLCRLRYKAPQRLLRSIYFALFHPHLTYMNIVWGWSAKHTISQIEILQKRALKLLYNLPITTPTPDTYKISNVPSLSSLINASAAIFMYKIKHSLIHTNTKLKFNTDIHTHYTRTHENIHLLQPNTTKYGTHSVYYKLITIYNDIPKNIKEICSLPQFRKKVLHWAIHNYCLQYSDGQ